MTQKDECRRKFNNVEILETYFDEKEYPIYRRRKNIYNPLPNDLCVVSHNRDILMDWNGHCNLEYVGNSSVIEYLYKYLFKGAKKQKLLLSKKDPNSNNQIIQHIQGRVISATQAMWRMFGYKTYPAPSPSVKVVKISTLSEVRNNNKALKITDMELYFRRPKKYEKLTFLEFWSSMIYSTKLTKHCKDNPDKFFIVNTSSKAYYVMERFRINTDNICRIGTVGFRNVEKFYLRLIMSKCYIPTILDENLNNCSIMVKNFFDQILIHNNISHNTYQESAVARGIVEDYNDLLKVFDDYSYLSPFNIRLLFVKQTYDGWPTKVILENEFWQYKMMPELQTMTLTSRDKYLLLLKKLDEQMYFDNNKRMHDYGYPKSKREFTETEVLKSKYKSKKEINEVSMYELCFFHSDVIINFNVFIFSFVEFARTYEYISFNSTTGTFI